MFVVTYSSKSFSALHIRKLSPELTVDIFDDIDAEAVPGYGGENFSSALPPGQVVGGTPGSDGTEEKL